MPIAIILYCIGYLKKGVYYERKKQGITRGFWRCFQGLAGCETDKDFVPCEKTFEGAEGEEGFAGGGEMMTALQQEVFDAIARSQQEFGQIIEPNLKKTLLKEIEMWTDDDCTKFLSDLMVNNTRRKLLKQWWEKNQNSEDDPVEKIITLKEFLDL